MNEKMNGDIPQETEDEERQNLEDKQESNSKSPQYIVMCIVIIFYRGSVQLFSLSLNQYIYFRLNADTNNATSKNTSNQTNTSVCGLNVVYRQEEHNVEKQAADWNTYLALVAYGLALISVVLQGGLSDSVGRKILLILSPLGALIKYIVGSAVVYFRFDLYYLLIASVFEGIGGTIYAFNLGCYAIASDVTKKDKTRSIGLGLFDVVFGFSMSSAQIGGGYLIQEVDFIIPCVISVGFVLISLLVCVCFVPETLKKKQDVPLKHTFRVIATNFKAFASNMKGSSNNRFPLAFTVFALMQFPRSRGVGLETLYVLQDPFCWDPILIGWYGAAKNFLSPFVSVGVLKLLHLCLSDELITMVGCLSTIAYFALLGFATTDWMIYGAAASGLLTNIAFTTLRGILSRATSSKIQGSMFSVLAAVTAGFRLLSNVTFNNIYANTQDVMPGITFFTMGGFDVLASFVCWFLICSPSLKSGYKEIN